MSAAKHSFSDSTAIGHPVVLERLACEACGATTGDLEPCAHPAGIGWFCGLHRPETNS